MGKLSIAIVMFLTLCSSAVLAASITVSPAGNAAYTVQGDMTGVAGIDLTLGYDSTSLMSPTVKSGSLVAGAMLIANTSIPGSIRVAIINASAFKGSGQIVVITFAERAGTGGMTSVSAKLIDSSGANLPVQAAIAGQQSTTQPASSNPAPSTSISTASVQTSAGYSSSSSTTGIVGLGSVSMPTDNQPKYEAKPAEPAVKIPPPESAPAVVTTQQREGPDEKPVIPEKRVEPKQVVYESVLERFKKYAGDRAPEALMALFDKPVAPELRQEPFIAVSDGSSRVRISADIPKGSGSSPNFRLSGVEVVSVTSDEKTGALLLEVLPKKDVTQATVIILAEGLNLTVPLTIVPPKVDGSATKASFADFLKDIGAKKPTYDLNNDGVHDYLDDYIYTGQYLAGKGAAEKKEVKKAKKLVKEEKKEGAPVSK